MNSKGVLFLNNRGVNESITELAPKRRTFADKYNGDPFDCIGGAINDLTADSKGGAYFSMGGLYYADPKGVVTKYGENLRTNGIILSPDEKTLYVTNFATLVAFDVQKDGSLTNQREFAKLEGGGGDGSTIDSAGRIYVTGTAGVHVIGPDGKYLGVIPAPLGVISVAFSGPDKKTLYAVAIVRDGDVTHNEAKILTMPMIAQGYKGRAK
jgi:gluconolactonase